MRIAKLNSELELNSKLRPRIAAVISGLTEKGSDHFRAVQRRLREAPSDEKPKTGAPNQPTYDMMLGQLLSDVWRESAWLVEGAKVVDGKVEKDGQKVDEKTGQPTWAEEAIPENKRDMMSQALKERMEWHLTELDARSTDVKKEIETEEKEQKKKITSDDIHEGWDKTVVEPAKPSPLEDKKKAKKESIEVLNPASVSTGPPDGAELEDVVCSLGVPEKGGRRRGRRIRSPFTLCSSVRSDSNR